jgi:hypothetical protein
MLIANMPSVLERGILSHNKIRGIPHKSIAMPEIQDRRQLRVVPGGRPLHDYANLYFHTRNPMMYLRRNQHLDLCILRISPEVLDLPNVVIADRNASTDYVRFAASPNGLSMVNYDLVFARDWNHENPIEKAKHKAVKCAEVLVPERIEPNFIIGCYVSGLESSQSLIKLLSSPDQLGIALHGDLFFNE